MVNENLEDAVVMANPDFNKEDFNWEITSSNEEALAKEENDFKASLETFQKIISTIDKPEDKVQLILDFYDNIVPDSIWNKYMEQYFKTKIPKNINMNAVRKLNLIDYSIIKSSKSLNDVRYKTSNCERSTAWLINEDVNFANEKPELLTLFKVNLYAATAKIQEEYIQIPYCSIIDTLKSMHNSLPYLYEYCFYKIFGYLDRKIIRSKEAEKLMESEPSFLMGVVRYRNSEVYGNLPAWNAIIKSKTIVKDIGYFTVSSYTKYIGNIWVDPAFRRKGVMAAMFNFIKQKLLPVENFLFIATKNPTVMGALSLFNSRFIGKDTPYISDNASYQLKQKLEQNYIENVFCISHKELPSNEEVFNALNEIKNRDLLFSEEAFPLLVSDSNEIGGEHLIGLLNGTYPSKLKFICVTNDLNVVPTYYNYYSPNFENHSKTHIVFELDGDKYLYPYFDGGLYVPVSNLLSVAKRIEEFRIDVIFNGDETIVIKHTTDDRVIFRGKLADTSIIKIQIEKFFEYIQYGIERIQLDEHYAIKEDNQVFKRDGYHAVEIDNGKIKFVSNLDTSIVTYKTIEEVIKNFPIN